MKPEHEERGARPAPHGPAAQAMPGERAARAADGMPPVHEHFIAEWAAHPEPAAGR